MPVHYMCTGAAMIESSIGRKVKQVGAITVPCPAAMTNYQSWMRRTHSTPPAKFLAPDVDKVPKVQYEPFSRVRGYDDESAIAAQGPFAGVVATPPVTGQKRRRAFVRHTHVTEQSKD
ncbi:hypothetical protein F443_02739 [Phytophthora nicotianae P1569]|uniref:Uncharacterized protein n=1 Tax=Phytophthora nicotianae P1569 TaxID=1317065 RepID=V9FSK3_PHYNI|nr:hypothetical protein F443_02739 [Phytophthora nicotianae P1569]